ncbi:MAG: corrinoid protein [Proteobacteria bacterium]|nr:corrinoid protein [Pseudomonadota bacterium]MBU2262424.1 corrinoid protein [Pseudomonadota bacterium]OHE24204.1 MAG: methyltransferase [Syntrophobacterales bacterium RBG_19FT_COMBO_59_10]
MIDAEKFYEALSQGETEEVKRLAQAALAAGDTAAEVLKVGLLPSMERVGVKFKNGEIYIPEVLIAARAMQGGMSILKPILAKSESVLAARIVIGTVKGDLHDIGKNLVAMMLEGGGFEVVDLGVDVAGDKFVEAVRQHRAQVLGMSALLTTTMGEMKRTVEALREAGLRDKVKVVVGGAPVTERFAGEIGADGYAADAATAVDVVKSLLAT